jgi:MFS family permease
MTSGQGSPYGGPGNQPDPGGPPQDWSVPPQDWNVPPQQPYGYGPAPSAPIGHGAPQPVERPETVRFAIGAFIATLILGLVSSILVFGQMDDLVARELAKSGSDVQLTDEVVRSGMVLGAVVTLIFVALQVLFLWFAWKGYNWARIVLWVLGGLAVASGLAGLGSTNPLGGFVAAVGVFQTLLTLVGIVLLALRPSNEWYRFRGWQRANGQG